MFLNIHGNENLIHKCPGKSKQKAVTGGFLLQSLCWSSCLWCISF